MAVLVQTETRKPEAARAAADEASLSVQSLEAQLRQRDAAITDLRLADIDSRLLAPFLPRQPRKHLPLHTVEIHLYHPIPFGISWIKANSGERCGSI